MLKYIVLMGGVLFGLVLIFGAVAALNELLQSQRWPTVNGTIRDAKLFRGKSTDRLEIEYSYEVGGATYTKESSIKAHNWQAVPSHYRPGSEISVHFDPLRNNRSYLIHEGFESPIALAVLGSIVWLICIPFIVWYGLVYRIGQLRRQAEHHLRRGFQTLEEAQGEIEGSIANTGDMHNELLLREGQVLESANQALAMLKEIEQRRKTLG